MKKLCNEQDFIIKDSELVKVKIAGPVLKVSTSSGKNTEVYIKKLSATEYVDIRTGEIFDYKKTDTRDQNIQNVCATLERLRGFINANVCGDKSRFHWITLTYRQRNSMDEEAVPMRDTKRLYIDYQNCIRQIRRDYSDANIEYIAVAEPQRSGSWHIHLIFIWDRRAPFIPWETFEDRYWRHGSVEIHHISKNCDNIGAYFSAYLGDVEYKEGDELQPGESIKTAVNSKGESKKYIKGGRLKYYPAGMNLYRCSRGIKKPIEAEMLYSEFRTMYPDAMQTYRNSVVLVDEKTEKTIQHCYEYYNTERKKDIKLKQFDDLSDRLKEIKRKVHNCG